MSESITYLSLCGLLGYGYPDHNLERALEIAPDLAFIGVDAGSTDPGPYYLGSGTSFVTDDRVRRDLESAVIFALKHQIPLIVGTSGGSGAKPHVELFLETLKSISKDNALSFDLGVIYTDISRELIRNRFEQGDFAPCGNAPGLEPRDIDQLINPVAQVGTEPIIDALKSGVDIVVCGRCCDTAIFAAMPILRGFDPALAMHCAKIAECGTLCATPGSAADSLLCTIRKDEFHVIPVNPERVCTPSTVAAHSLYEQPDPGKFVEPEGVIDLTGCVYTQDGTRGVRVTGTKLHEASRSTLKLEGAKLEGYRAISIASVCDPVFLKSLKTVEQSVRDAVNLAFSQDEANERFRLLLRTFGAQALGATTEYGLNVVDEAAIVVEVVAADQELANSILSFARSTMLHQSFPGRKTTAGNLAFPFSPSDSSCGPVYAFALYHLLDNTDNPLRFKAIRYSVSDGDFHANI